MIFVYFFPEVTSLNMAATAKKSRLSDINGNFAEGSIRRLYLENFVYVVFSMLLMLNGQIVPSAA